MLPRYKSIRKRRGKPRPGRLKGKAHDKLRHDCFERDGGKCVDCGRDLIEHPRSIFQDDAYHMAHIRNKRMWGDNLPNVRSKCSGCHLVLEHNPKSVPRKVRP